MPPTMQKIKLLFSLHTALNLKGHRLFGDPFLHMKMVSINARMIYNQYTKGRQKLVRIMLTKRMEKQS